MKILSKKIQYFIFIYICITNFTWSDEINYKIFTLSDGHTSARLVNQGKQFVCFGSSKYIDLRDSASGELIMRYELSTNATDYFQNSADNMYWLSLSAEYVDSYNVRERKVIIWKNGNVLHEMIRFNAYDKIMRAALSVDSQIYIIGLQNGNLEIYDTITDKFLYNCIPERIDPIIDPSYPPSLAVISIHISEDGNTILSNHCDKYTRMWSRKDGKLLYCFKTTKDLMSYFSSTESIDNKARYEYKEDDDYDKVFITDIETNNIIAQFIYKNMGYFGAIGNVDKLSGNGFPSPDKKYRIRYDKNHLKISIYDNITNQEMKVINYYDIMASMNFTITSVEFSQDSRMILLGDEKCRAIVVDLTALYPSGINKIIDYK